MSEEICITVEIGEDDVILVDAVDDFKKKHGITDIRVDSRGRFAPDEYRDVCGNTDTIQRFLDFVKTVSKSKTQFVHFDKETQTIIVNELKQIHRSGKKSLSDIQ